MVSTRFGSPHRSTDKDSFPTILVSSINKKDNEKVNFNYRNIYRKIDRFPRSQIVFLVRKFQAPPRALSIYRAGNRHFGNSRTLYFSNNATWNFFFNSFYTFIRYDNYYFRSQSIVGILIYEWMISPIDWPLSRLVYASISCLLSILALHYRSVVAHRHVSLDLEFSEEYAAGTLCLCWITAF